MSDDIKKDLEKILEKLENIEDIINRPHEPYVYPDISKSQPYVPVAPLGDYTKCSKCGMVFDGVTSYSCPYNGCPTFS